MGAAVPQQHRQFDELSPASDYENRWGKEQAQRDDEWQEQRVSTPHEHSNADRKIAEI